MKKTGLVVIVVVVLTACRTVRPPVERNVPVGPVTEEKKVQPQEESRPAPVKTVTPYRKPEMDVTPARNEMRIDEVNRALRDAYFDYNRWTLREDATEALKHNAGVIWAVKVSGGELRVVVEGHCDERGSSEYNLALGDRRARAAADYLVGLGMPESILQVVSYGREAPQCTEATEECWRKNRRAHLEVRAPQR